MYKILEEFIILIESKYSKKIIVAIYTQYNLCYTTFMKLFYNHKKTFRERFPLHF